MCRASIVLAAVVLMNTGCYSAAQIVLARDLGPLVTSDHRAPLFLRTAAGRGVRLDPNSQISVRRIGRGNTPYQDVGSLETGKLGLRIELPVDYEDLHQIQVTGLDPVSVGTLQEVFGPTMKPSLDLQTWSLTVTEPSKLETQIANFVRIAAQRHGRDDYEVYERQASRDTEGRMHGEEFGLSWVHARGRAAGLGRWSFSTRWEQVAEMDASTFICPPGTFIRGSHNKSSNYEVCLPEQFWVHSGIPWDQVEHIEVSNFSGAITLGTIAGYTALSVMLLPVAGLARLGDKLVGNHGVSRVTSAVGEVYVRSFANGEGSPDRAAVTPAPSPNLAESAKTRPLFGALLRRQSIVRFVFAAEVDVGTDFARLEGAQTGGLAAFRFKDLIELGVGGRYVLSTLPGAPGQPASLLPGGVGSFHLGLHMNMDARQRFAIPLAMDLGAGGALRFQGRFQIGLRVRVTGPFYLGVYPLNPVVSLYRDDEEPDGAASPSADAPRPPKWTFRSTIESGVAF